MQHLRNYYKTAVIYRENNTAWLVSIFGNNTHDGIEIINPMNGIPYDDVIARSHPCF